MAARLELNANSSPLALHATPHHNQFNTFAGTRIRKRTSNHRLHAILDQKSYPFEQREKKVGLKNKFYLEK
jgi:hypothetical protein